MSLYHRKHMKYKYVKKKDDGESIIIFKFRRSFERKNESKYKEGNYITCIKNDSFSFILMKSYVGIYKVYIASDFLKSCSVITSKNHQANSAIFNVGDILTCHLYESQKYRSAIWLFIVY